jgi:oligopeptide/dipeptide ABC transporter ATP-binding protein
MIPLLEVENLHIRFTVGSRVAAFFGRPRTIEAVAGVSFGVRPGETYALVGESGSGRTVAFDGRTISGLGERELLQVRRQVALMFQDPVGSLSPRLSVRSIIGEPFRVHHEAEGVDGKVKRLLDEVGLPATLLERYPHQLSGGQARRVGVARALALRPKLLIADEPTAGLDVSVQGEVLNLLNKLQAALGITVVIITHNLNVVRHVADRVAVMYLGRIIEEGPTNAVFARPRHRYTAALLSANPEPDPDARRERLEIEGEVPSLFGRPSGCEFHPRCSFALDVCRNKRPGRTSAEAGHSFACHNPG